MKKTNIFPIFYPTSPAKYDRTTPEFKQAYNKPGVYVIFRMKENDILPVYVGSSKNNAGKSCIRHFYRYNDVINKDERGEYNKDFQYRVSFHREKRQTKFFVKFYLFPDDTDPETVMRKEQSLIEALAPKYNINLKTGKPDSEFLEQTTEEAEEAADKYNDYAAEIIEEDIPEAPF